MSLRSIASIAIVAAATSTAGAELIAGWEIVTAFPTGAGNVPTGTTYTVGAANLGANAVGSELLSVHQLAAATYTSPAGNGSQYAFSSNNWLTGDYYEARVSTLGYSGVELSWDQARSSTGAKQFELIMSVDGGSNWTTVLATYDVLQSGGGGAPGTWSASGAYNPIYTTVASLGAMADNQSEVIVRWRALVDAVSSTGAYAASGSVRIDNVMFNSIPAPGAVALLGLAGLAARRRR
ncbi:MAG: hypothetical protein RI967_2416 [Planctomycetota bacterium]|jgi:hypothetical protein